MLEILHTTIYLILAFLLGFSTATVERHIKGAYKEIVIRIISFSVGFIATLLMTFITIILCMI